MPRSEMIAKLLILVRLVLWAAVVSVLIIVSFKRHTDNVPGAYCMDTCTVRMDFQCLDVFFTINVIEPQQLGSKALAPGTCPGPADV